MIGHRASQASDGAKFHLGLSGDANPGFRARRSAPIPDDGQGTAVKVLEKLPSAAADASIRLVCRYGLVLAANGQHWSQPIK